MKFRIPEGVDVVMGHTRLTTQGDEKFNANNHPFKGMAGTVQFALAHNGVLYNDEMLRRLEHLPKTPILTDSYVAVQLIEKAGDVNFETLRNMAEQLEGSFKITVMDSSNNVYFIKGDNPMCIAHLPKIGAYVYASTEEILLDGIRRSHLDLGERIKVQLVCGEIMRIDSHGKRETERFDTNNLFFGSGYYRFGYGTAYSPSSKHISLFALTEMIHLLVQLRQPKPTKTSEVRNICRLHVSSQTRHIVSARFFNKKLPFI